MRASIDQCAHEILEVVPVVMSVIRAEMRRHRQSDLSVPQFRVLAFLNRRPGASLSEVAEHIGLTLPSMSTLVDGLVVRGLVSRQPSPDDRRRVILALTTPGVAAQAAVRQATQTQLAEMLTELSGEQRGVILQALQVLRPVFAVHEGDAVA